MTKRLWTGPLAIEAITIAGGAALGAQGLHVVASPFINNSTLSGAAIIADNDIWSVGAVAGSTAGAESTLAEHFDGTSWSIIATPAVSGGMFSSVGGTATMTFGP